MYYMLQDTFPLYNISYKYYRKIFCECFNTNPGILRIKNVAAFVQLRIMTSASKINRALKNMYCNI